MRESIYVARGYTLLFGLLLIVVGLMVGSAQAAPPANDNFANAEVLSGATGSVMGTNAEATSESGEPAHMYDGPYKSVWYKWVAPNSDSIDFDTQGSSFDTVLAVYTGAAVDGLTLVDNNDDDPLFGCCNSRVSFTPTSGATYHIAVDGFGSYSYGDLALNWGAPPPTPTISGTFHLPDGKVAPAGGLWVYPSVYNVTSGNYYYPSGVQIPAGADSIDYTADLFSLDGDELIVGYEVNNADYISQGYYNSGGTTWNPDNAEALGGGVDHGGIDMTLLNNGNVISGTVSLPGTDVASNDMHVSVGIYDSNNMWNGGWSSVYIPAGNSSADYSIMVPPATGAQWGVNYSYYGSDTYWNSGYYTTTGTDWNFKNASLLAGGVNHANIDLELLRGKTVSGTYSLPQGASPAASDISFSGYLILDMGDQSYAVYYHGEQIPSGQSSVDYSYLAPKTDVTVGYYYGGTESYYQNGYYNSTGTTWLYDNATWLGGSADHTGIDVSFLSEKTVSGNIQLPPGVSAPYDYWFDIRISQPGSSFSNYVGYTQLVTGSDTASYSVDVPAADVSIGYEIWWWGEPYLPSAWYSGTGTQWDPAQAGLLTGTSDHSGIDMDVLTGRPISGTFSRPSEAATEDAFYYIVASNQAGSSYDSYYGVYLAQGETTFDYTLYVPDAASTSWQVYYDYYGGRDYPWYGYYNSSGTMCEEYQATLLPGGQDHSGIDLTQLLKCRSPWILFMPAILGGSQQ